jgi:hypothetical protein
VKTERIEERNPRGRSERIAPAFVFREQVDNRKRLHSALA